MERLKAYKDPGVYSLNVGQQAWAGIPSRASSQEARDILWLFHLNIKNKPPNPNDNKTKNPKPPPLEQPLSGFPFLALTRTFQGEQQSYDQIKTMNCAAF